MVLLPDSPSSFYITFGLNNIVARETRVEVRRSPISMVLIGLLTGKLTDRFWQTKPAASPEDSLLRSNSPTERLKNHVWPALKKGISTSLVESTKMTRKRQDSQPSNVALPSVTFEPKQLKKAASGSLTERREIALAELDMMSMKAIQGPRMDSREYTVA